jgi:hypothetical protein
MLKAARAFSKGMGHAEDRAFCPTTVEALANRGAIGAKLPS